MSTNHNCNNSASDHDNNNDEEEEEEGNLPSTSTSTNSQQSVYFKNPNSKISDRNSKLRKLPRLTDENFCNVKLIVGNGTAVQDIHVQSSLLHHIPYFIKEFNKSSCERYEFVLSELNWTAVNLVLDFLWSDAIKIPLNVQKIYEIWKVAELFQEDDLKSECRKLLVNQLSPHNCFRIYKMAQHNSAALVKSVEGFIMEQVLADGDMSEFYQFGIKEVQQFVTNFSSAYSTPEEQLAVFKTGLKWIKHSEPSRKAHLLTLLQVCNLSTLLKTNPRLAREEFSDGSALDDDPQCAKLMGRVLQDLQECTNLNNPAPPVLPAKSQSYGSSVEIIDISADDDDDGQVDFNPVIEKVESIEDEVDLEHFSPSPSTSTRTRSPRQRECKKRSLPIILDEDTEQDLSSDEDMVVEYVNDNDDDDGVGSDSGSLFELPQTPPRTRSSSTRNSTKPATNGEFDHQYQSAASSDDTGYRSDTPQRHDVKKRRLTPRRDPVAIQQKTSTTKKSSRAESKIDGRKVAKAAAKFVPPPPKPKVKKVVTFAAKTEPSPQFKILYPVVCKKQMHLYSYDFKTKQIPQLEHKIQQMRDLSSIVVTASHVYDIGGQTPNLKSKRHNGGDSDIVEVFSKNEETGDFGSELKEARREFATCICLDEIYVIGGCQGPDSDSIAINLVEKLKISDGKVHPKPEWNDKLDYLNHARGCLDVSVLNNKIFAVGGIGDGNAPVDIVEIYDAQLGPEAADWERGPDLNEKRGFLKTAICGGKIYAAGGLGVGRQVLNTVEVYDPNFPSSKKKKWTRVANMNCPRKSFGLIESNGILYAIGGNTDSKIQSIEFYDPRVNIWQLMTWPANLHKDANFWSSVISQ